MEKIIITIDIEIMINKHDYSLISKEVFIEPPNSTFNITFRKTTRNKLVTSKKVK